METVLQIETTIEHDGELHLVNLPLKCGQHIVVQVQVTSTPTLDEGGLTARDLLESEAIGVWEGRADI